MLTTGGTGQEWYDQHFVFGTQIVNRLNTANYAAVQFGAGDTLRSIFPSGGTFGGWLTGPGGRDSWRVAGPQSAKWVHDNPQITASTRSFLRDWE